MCVLESPFTPALMSWRITVYTPNYILYAPYFRWGESNPPFLINEYGPCVINY